jgi:translation initiation factor 6
MKLFKTNFQGNPNVGLYAFCTDSYCLVAPEFTKKQVATFEKVLGVPVHQIRISNTSLLGALLSGNSSMLLVPDIVHKDELKELDKLDIPYTIVPGKLTALGNNILCNDTGAVVNVDYSPADRKRISEALGVPVVATYISDAEVCGSCAVLNKDVVVLHAFSEKKHVEVVEKCLGIKSVPGTVNFGSPYVGSGVFANSNGMIVGDKSTALEIENIYEALGFLTDDD